MLSKHYTVLNIWHRHRLICPILPKVHPLSMNYNWLSKIGTQTFNELNNNDNYSSFSYIIFVFHVLYERLSTFHWKMTTLGKISFFLMKILVNSGFPCLWYGSCFCPMYSYLLLNLLFLSFFFAELSEYKVILILLFWMRELSPCENQNQNEWDMYKRTSQGGVYKWKRWYLLNNWWHILKKKHEYNLMS